MWENLLGAPTPADGRASGHETAGCAAELPGSIVSGRDLMARGVEEPCSSHIHGFRVAPGARDTAPVLLLPLNGFQVIRTAFPPRPCRSQDLSSSRPGPEPAPGAWAMGSSRKLLRSAALGEGSRTSTPEPGPSAPPPEPRA